MENIEGFWFGKFEAYLAHSKYGLNGEKISLNKNSSYKTGYGSDGSSVYNTEVGMNSSTTQNVYGIYDMRGGANEIGLFSVVSALSA